ncbi:MAG: cytochrome C [Hyphomicrobium sp.]
MKAAYLVVLALGLSIAPSAHSQEIGDPARGLSYAEKNCTECHAVHAEDDISRNYGAPTFLAVANTPGMTERALGVWFQSSHPTMPQLVIPREDLDNVIAYIMSLKGKRPAE